MMYRNGQRLRTIALTDEDIRALVAHDYVEHGPALAALRLHLDGPPVAVLAEIERQVEEGMAFRRDAVRLHMDDGTVVVLEVSPDGDYDGEKMVDCTSVSASWLVDNQSVEFELDGSLESEVIDQWAEEGRVNAR